MNLQRRDNTNDIRVTTGHLKCSSSYLLFDDDKKIQHNVLLHLATLKDTQRCIRPFLYLCIKVNEL